MLAAKAIASYKKEKCKKNIYSKDLISAYDEARAEGRLWWECA